MDFRLVKNKAQLEEIRRALPAKFRGYKTVSADKMVSWSMPALPDALPKIGEALYNSDYLKQYSGIYYYMETKGQYIANLIPANAYFPIVSRAISDKRYSLQLSITRAELLQAAIHLGFVKTKKKLPRANQTSFSANEEVYQLKSEISNILFTLRSLLDTITTLVHLMYGPNSRTFHSFTLFAKFITKESHKDGEIGDAKMKEFIKTEMEWFNQLRDIRDYITHFSSIDLGFYETDEGILKAYLHDRFDLDLLLATMSQGLNSFMSFFDDHFSQRILKYRHVSNR